MPKRPDWDKENKRTQIKQKGYEASYEPPLTNKQRDALQIGHEIDARNSNTRKEQHAKSLAANLEHPSLTQIEKQVVGLENIIRDLPPNTPINKIRELENALEKLKRRRRRST